MKPVTASFIGAVVAMCLGVFRCLAGNEWPSSASHRVDFKTEIEPIFARNCFSCHGEVKQKSGLRLDARGLAMKGGRSGIDIVPGDSGASRLVRLVSGLEDDLIMPEKGERLSPVQISLLRAWIDQGANWPESADKSAAAIEVFWSLKKLEKPALPTVRGERWVNGAIDRFVLSKLEHEGIHPSAEADPATLIRRVTFDLTGLPPTPEEVRAFVGDHSSDAYEKVVERLLNSPRYGERWARHWLDVVRFSESHGFEMNQPRPNAWPYRDYVISSFNEDKPYDRFVFEQLAGDTVGVDEATGFMVGGPWDQVKSPDIQLTKQQRADELHDIVSTTGSTFLGLTVGCARCHDHKFDPISQRDYYSMQAVFVGVEHGEREWKSRVDERNSAEAIAAAQREIETLDGRLESFIPAANLRGQLRPPVNAVRNVDRFAPILARFIRFTINGTASSDQPCLDEVEIYAAQNSPRRNVALASSGAHVSVSSTLPGFAMHKVEHLIDGKYGNDWSWISNEAGRGEVRIELETTNIIDRVVWDRDRNGGFSDRLVTSYRIDVALDTNHWVTVAGSGDREPYRADGKANLGYSAAGMPQAAAKELEEMLAERARQEAMLERLNTKPQVYAGKFTTPPPWYRFYRGDPMQPREKVTPGGLSQIEPQLAIPQEATDSERRVALARWICDPRNPLAARVIVNRLWHYHFGQGIVNTPSDFGEMGGRPSHPELLDWLACELSSNGWRLKPLQRMIVLSRAYRQASAINADALKRDAGNRWIWRFAPQRLEAEEIRDNILATTGRLDLHMGGPGFDLFLANDNYVRVYAAKENFGPPEWRRMIYQFKPRMQQDGVFGAFDCPDGAQIAPKRTSSITALQALNLMNSEFLVQQAGLLGARLEFEAGGRPEAQIKRGYWLAFGRAPSKRELHESLTFVRREGLSAFCRALFNANEFVFVY